MNNPYDLVLRGGRAVLPGHVEAECDIAVRDGKIAALLAPGESCLAEEVLNIGGLTVMPGAIDVHLHLGSGNDISRPRQPADADRETAAAAVGGVTCFVPYLMAAEPFETIFGDVCAVTQAGARIDFGYHFCISTEDQLAAVPRYIREMGVPSLKIFLNNRRGEGARLGLPDVDDGFLFRLCEAAAAHGGMVCPHPETIEIAFVLRERVRAADPDGKGGLAAWNATRPPFVEADALQSASLIADAAGATLYAVHTSSGAALAAALRSRAAGARIFIETCPQYLTHDISWAGGEVGKINPPLRTAADREALWQGLLSGAIDTVASDHVHRSHSAKSGGIWAASPGCPGLETLLPVLLHFGRERGLTLPRIADLVATNPARLMGLSHVKGQIRPGLDADFTIIDPEARWVLEPGAIMSSAGYSIYERVRFRGRVRHTLVRGKPVLRDGALDPAAIGTGRYVPRWLTDKKTGLLF